MLPLQHSTYVFRRDTASEHKGVPQQLPERGGGSQSHSNGLSKKALG